MSREMLIDLLRIGAFLFTLPAWIPVCYLVWSTFKEFKNGHDKLFTLALQSVFIGMLIITSITTVTYLHLLVYHRAMPVLYNVKNIIVAIMVLISSLLFIRIKKLGG